MHVHACVFACVHLDADARVYNCLYVCGYMGVGVGVLWGWLDIIACRSMPDVFFNTYIIKIFKYFLRFVIIFEIICVGTTEKCTKSCTW